MPTQILVLKSCHHPDSYHILRGVVDGIVANVAVVAVTVVVFNIVVDYC